MGEATRTRRKGRTIWCLLVAFILSVGGQEAAGYQRRVVRYEIPDVTLLSQDGRRVELPRILRSDKAVFLTFFFSTCTTVCPVISAGFSSLPKALGPSARDAKLISITIDPDHDVPSVLRDYGKRFDAGPEWQLLTGSHEDIARVRKAFDADSPDKMSHTALYFLHAPGSESWIRIEGLIGASDLVSEYRGLGRP